MVENSCPDGHGAIIHPLSSVGGALAYAGDRVLTGERKATKWNSYSAYSLTILELRELWARRGGSPFETCLSS